MSNVTTNEASIENDCYFDDNDYAKNMEICMALVRADSDDEVVKILTQHNIWDDESLWLSYGGKENNFSSIGNQQESADSALVEKLVNSADTILIKNALKKGIAPESAAAPKSISDALAELMNIPDGKISNLSESESTKLASNIGLVATGSNKAKPSYAIFDKGTGQPPSLFKNTFLSLNDSNKLKIPFVQGKFNMGSTGVLQFCGSNNLQLILSRWASELPSNCKDSEYWGFTIVRREAPQGSMKSSRYTYLAPNGLPLKFMAPAVNVLPRKYPDALGEPLESGTYIKLYEYDIGPALRTNILFDLYNRLNLLMPEAALPVRFYERRNGYSGHSFESTLAGLNSRVENDKRENLEAGYPSSALFTVDGSELKMDIYAFKIKDGKSAKAKYAKREGVVFSINGQAHGFIPKEFFSRKSVGMSYLADSLLISVDCTNITGQQREDLFMNSRDRLRNGPVKTTILKNIELAISSHKGLKQLREERKRLSVEEKLSDDKPLASVLEKVLNDNKALADLLFMGKKIKNPFKNEARSVKPVYDGKDFPSYFSAVKEYDKIAPKNCEIDRSFRVKFKTDAENQYFTRPSEPGSIIVATEDGLAISPSISLWNGDANLTIDLPSKCSVGDLVGYEYEVTDDTRAIPFKGKFWIRIIPKTERYGGKKHNRKKPADKDGEGTFDHSFFALPQTTPVSKENWPQYEFNDNSGLAIRYDPDKKVYDFFYNADNVYLKNAQKTNSDNKAQIIDMQFKSALVLIGMSMIKANADSDRIERDVQTFTSTITPVLIPMIRSLGSIQTDE